MPVYLRAKFEVFSIVLTSLRQGEGGGNLTTSPPLFPAPQNEPLKIPPRLKPFR